MIQFEIEEYNVLIRAQRIHLVKFLETWSEAILDPFKVSLEMLKVCIRVS